MEKDFLKNLSFESTNLVSALLLDKKSKDYSINWGKNVFSKNTYFIKKLLCQIKSNYPKNIENNTKISVSTFDIKKCGNIPCIYKSFLQNKNKVKELINYYANNLSLELEEILLKNDDGLVHFQEFINKIKDLGLLQEITVAIKKDEDKSNDYFSDVYV